MTTIVLIVGILALAGVIYEAISSSSQQQHISTSAAEGFQHLPVGGRCSSRGWLFWYGSVPWRMPAELARCQEGLQERAGKSTAMVTRPSLDALQAAQSAEHQAAAQAGSGPASQTPSFALKEDAYKPVFKAIRDSFRSRSVPRGTGLLHSVHQPHGLGIAVGADHHGVPAKRFLEIDLKASIRSE